MVVAWDLLVFRTMKIVPLDKPLDKIQRLVADQPLSQPMINKFC